MAALHKSYHDQGKNNVKKVRPGTDRRQPRKVKLDWLIIKKSTADLLVILKYAKKGPGEYGIGGIHVHCQGSVTPLLFNSFGKSFTQ